MDTDEAFAALIGLAATVVAAVRWYGPLVTLSRLGRRPRIVTGLALTPPACLLAVAVVLQAAADPQVRGHPEYLALFLLDGSAFLAATAAALPFVLGVSVRDDALERRNGPATAVVCGALAAVTAVYAGANVGSGPTIWTTLGPALVGVAGLAVLALAHAAGSGLSESVTVDRDPAAAVRAVGLHLAMGLVLARAVAGDWVSANATVADLARRGWPAALLAGVAVVVDRLHARRPWPCRRAVRPALIVAAAYLGAALMIDALPPLRAGRPVGDPGGVRRRLALDHAKWDPQVGDVSTVSPFPLLLRRSHWEQLARWTESLAVESAAAEAELLGRPDLLSRLGLPRRLRRALAPVAAVPRLVRFDFHWTTEGWRISEANADVPGGLCEASALPVLMGGVTAGDPAAAWADAVVGVAVAPDVALLTAPGFMEDHQVMAHLADRLRDRGCRPYLAGPSNLAWSDGRPSLPPTFGAGPLGAVVRFVQAEWLPRWPGWRQFLRPSPVPVLNPVTSAVVESKRFPLTWDGLRTPLPTWRALLPETVDPRSMAWRRAGQAWLLKSAFCNTGDTVSAAGWGEAKRWRSARRSAWLRPGGWVAQRRFTAVPIDTPSGPRVPCVGVYAVAGRAVGIYGRLSAGPVIDFAAEDVAVLLDDG